MLLMVYVLLLLVIMAATHCWRFTAFNHPRFLQACGGLALAVWVRAALRKRAATDPPAILAAVRVLRDFLPFFLALVLYEALHDLTPLVRPDVVDAKLIAIDRAVFGVDVSLWLGQFARPWLTHAMVYAYLSYFFAPVLLACVMYWRGDHQLFREYMVTLTVVTMLGYVGYLLVPAVGPYVFQAELFPTRLPGGEQTHFFIRAIDSFRGVARDCFPSMHTAHTTVVLAFAWRFDKRLFGLYLPIGLGLYVSTVFLRMHYVVDVAAGFAVSALAIWLGPRVERGWYRKA